VAIILGVALYPLKYQFSLEIKRLFFLFLLNTHFSYLFETRNKNFITVINVLIAIISGVRIGVLVNRGVYSFSFQISLPINKFLDTFQLIENTKREM